MESGRGVSAFVWELIVRGVQDGCSGSICVTNVRIAETIMLRVTDGADLVVGEDEEMLPRSLLGTVRKCSCESQ